MRKPVCLILAAGLLATCFSVAEADPRRTFKTPGHHQKSKRHKDRPRICRYPVHRNGPQPVFFELPEVEVRKLAVKKVTPEYVYPDYATRVLANVQVGVRIGTFGTVIGVRFLSGPELFTTEALRAAYQWRFQPFLKDGKPVLVKSILTFRFDESGAVKQD